MHENGLWSSEDSWKLCILIEENTFFENVDEIAIHFKFKSQLVAHKKFLKNRSYLRYLALNFGSFNSHLARLELNGIHFCQFNYQIFAVFMDILFSHFTGNRQFDAFLKVCFEQF